MALKDRQFVTPAGIVITALLTVVVIAISAILFVCGGCGTVLTGPPLPDEPLQAPGETPPYRTLTKMAPPPRSVARSTGLFEANSKEDEHAGGDLS